VELRQELAPQAQLRPGLPPTRVQQHRVERRGRPDRRQPELTVETSDAAQVEVNARIWKGERRIRELSFRIDGSYTRINNQIQITAGNYVNSGERGLASAEFLGKLYVQGGHRIELGYTWLRADTSDRGRLRNLPSTGSTWRPCSRWSAASCPRPPTSRSPAPPKTPTASSSTAARPSTRWASP